MIGPSVYPMKPVRAKIDLYPIFEERDSGEVVVGQYTYPKPGDPLAPDLKSVPLRPADQGADDPR